MHWLIVEEGSDRPAKPEIVAKDVLFSMRVITLDNETDSNILAQVKKKLEYMTDDEIVGWAVSSREHLDDKLFCISLIYMISKLYRFTMSSGKSALGAILIGQILSLASLMLSCGYALCSALPFSLATYALLAAF